MHHTVNRIFQTGKLLSIQGMNNVALRPHAASAARETRQAMGRRVIDNLEPSEYRPDEMVSPAY